MEAKTPRQAFGLALVRRRQVEQLVQLSRSTIYACVKAGTFPAPISIGARAVAWRLSDVEAWIEARPLSRVTRTD